MSFTKEELKFLEGVFDNIKPIEETTEDGKVVETTVLDTINISMIGPRGAGKTSLLATLFKYIEENIKPKHFDIILDEDSEKRIKRFKGSLQIIKNAENGADVSSKIGALDPTQNIQTFKFFINFKKENNDKKKTIVVSLPFVIMDVPGGVVEEETKSKQLFEEFKKHLADSSVLLIPFDSMLYMQKPVCDDADAYDTYQAQHLGIQFIDKYCLQWAKNREEDKHPKAVFIAMKSETYHTHKVTENKSKDCYTRFRDLFKESITKLAKNSPNSLDIIYTPVETIGCIQCVNSLFENNELSHKFIKHNNIPDYLGAGVVLKAIFERAKEHLEEVYGNANKWVKYIENQSIWDMITNPWKTIGTYWSKEKVTEFYNDIRFINDELDSVTSNDSCLDKDKMYHKNLADDNDKY